jgi:putative transcriptional regulator
MDLSLNNIIEPSKGKALLGEPFMDDAYFGRSVVLLCEHNSEGSFGFVLNNYSGIDLRSVLPEFPEVSTRISVGGPVKTNNLYYMHNNGAIDGCEEVVPGIFLGGDFESLKQQMELGVMSPDSVRFFAGYSGWSPLQLEQEIERKSWLVTPIKPGDILNTSSDNLWETLMARMGGKYKAMAHFPKDPGLN